MVDNESGARIQLTPDEDTLVRQISVHGGRASSPRDATASLDHVAGAIVQRRLGYGFAWMHLSSAADVGRDKR
jgi:hypothetical protein